MAQELYTIPPSKTRRLGMQPQIWRCGNPECTNLISDVDQKTIPKTYCSTACRESVNNRKRNEKNRLVKRIFVPRPCEFCSKIFIPKKKNTTRFCSHLCSVRSFRGNKININCGNCGITFKSKKNKQYCSEKCRITRLFKRKMEALNNA